VKKHENTRRPKQGGSNFSLPQTEFSNFQFFFPEGSKLTILKYFFEKVGRGGGKLLPPFKKKIFFTFFEQIHSRKNN